LIIALSYRMAPFLVLSTVSVNGSVLLSWLIRF
jgi:hypothetical protein